MKHQLPIPGWKAIELVKLASDCFSELIGDTTYTKREIEFAFSVLNKMVSEYVATAAACKEDER